jgi:hypothetical protein
MSDLDVRRAVMMTRMESFEKRLKKPMTTSQRDFWLAGYTCCGIDNPSAGS